MGHRDTSKEQSGKCAVCSSGGGAAAAAGEPVVISAANRRDAHHHAVGVCAILFALRFYKSYLSPLFAGGCRFQPTCSQYAYEAVERFGVACGSWLTLKRLTRCQPFSSQFGYDPVPETWESSAPAVHRDRIGPEHPAGAHHEVQL